MPCPHVREIPPPRAVDGGGEMTEDRRSTGSPTASPRPPARAPCGRALRAAGARIPRDRTAQVSSALSLTDRFHGCRCPRGPPRDPVNETAGSATGARGTGDPCGRLAMRDGFVKCRRNRTRDRKIGQHRTHIGRKSDRGPTGANPLKWRICAASRRMARAGQLGEGRECDRVAHLTALNEINELAADPCLRVVFRDWGLAEKATVLTQSSAARQRRFVRPGAPNEGSSSKCKTKASIKYFKSLRRGASRSDAPLAMKDVPLAMEIAPPLVLFRAMGDVWQVDRKSSAGRHALLEAGAAPERSRASPRERPRQVGPIANRKAIAYGARRSRGRAQAPRSTQRRRA